MHMVEIAAMKISRRKQDIHQDRIGVDDWYLNGSMGFTLKKMSEWYQDISGYKVKDGTTLDVCYFGVDFLQDRDRKLGVCDGWKTGAFRLAWNGQWESSVSFCIAYWPIRGVDLRLATLKPSSILRKNFGRTLILIDRCQIYNELITYNQS